MIRLVLVPVLLLLCSTALAFSYTLEITGAELQEKLSNMMPLERKSLFITLVLTEPKVALLKASNKIGLSFHITVSAPGGIKGTGKTSITGSLRYDSSSHAFYLNDPVIELLEIDQVPDKHLPKIKKISQQAISKLLIKRPIYRLKDDNLKQKLAKSMLKSISIRDEILFIELGIL